MSEAAAGRKDFGRYDEGGAVGTEIEKKLQESKKARQTSLPPIPI